ncbi:hypothetical protein HSBAA_57000 [Vreelandella sulfidaeris]|uniref:GguC protein n=1 Tax=Vreelandella sulfidaeris TaxID=115553 RepID=A0A455UN69_9GAMM|nr:hypothetical protein HSBAA_57000 [Halomonas sulfidaeris]
MRLIQCDHQGQVHAALVESEEQVRLLDCDTYTLANRAISAGQPMSDAITAAMTDTRLDYQALVDDKRLLPPLTHPDPAHCLVTGTGLTHLGSADTRSAMHAQSQKQAQAAEEDMTDSMRMFKLGVEGGKPNAGEMGAQPEWFYKGDGQCVMAPEAEIPRRHSRKMLARSPSLPAFTLLARRVYPGESGMRLVTSFLTMSPSASITYGWLTPSSAPAVLAPSC